MISTKIYLPVLVILLIKTEMCYTYCVMYGQCNLDSTNNDKIQNCLNDEDFEAQTLNKTSEKYQEAVSRLKYYCPEFYETTDDPPVCCDTDQVVTMAGSIYLSEVFSRCPTCLKNLIRSICAFSCSPNQADFMVAAGISEGNGTFNKGRYITELNVTISEYYMNTTYKSCLEVSMPSTGGVVMDSACGDWASAYCTPERWFRYMGVDNPFKPFPINYIPSLANDSSVLNPRTVNCNEKYDVSSAACSCVDCRLSCINGEFLPIDSKYFYIGNLFGPTFVASLILLLCCCALVFVILIRKKRETSLRNLNENKPNGIRNARTGILGRLGDEFDRTAKKLFYRLGTYIATHPSMTLYVWSLIIIALSTGIFFLTLTTNTVELWAAPTSQSRLEKNYFDSYFGPFYRTEQIYIKTVGIDVVPYDSSQDSSRTTVGPIFNKTFLNAVFDLQKKIENITFPTNESLFNGLEKICYAPVINSFSAPITINDCTIQSVLGYFKNDIDYFNSDSDYIRTMESCFRSPYTVDCLAPYGGPVLPGLAIGGSKTGDHMDSTGLSLTFIVKNNLRLRDSDPAKVWEEKFISFLKNWDEKERPSFMSIAFSSERSIEDEITRLSLSEASTVILSYIIMFAYILIALGRIRSWSNILVDSKVTLAAGGIVLVLASVACSLGTGGYISTTITLLTVEVIPFITLAVGVDNIFIITQSFQDSLQENEELTHIEHVASTLSSVGPSILLTTFSEIVCFALGTISDMPAVNTFATFATLSLAYGVLLQLTAFVALLSIDASRYSNNRCDIFCCFKLKKSDVNIGKSWLDYFWSEICTPFIMKFETRSLALFLFSALFAVNLMFAPSVEIGLDQQIAMPDDSHVVKYFEYMADLLGTGSPIYWVTRGNLNYSNPEIRSKFCGSTGCQSNSVATQLYTTAQQSDVTFVSTQASSWLDDYKDWSELSGCCKYFKSNNSFCPHTQTNSLCNSCAINVVNLTWDEYFPRYLSYFLQDNADDACAKGGHAAYADGIDYYLDEDGKAIVNTAYVMSYHTVLKTSKEYYEALRYARFVAENLTKTIDIEGVDVFPYSIFYVYYEQYLSIWNDTLESTGYSLLAVLVVTFIFSGFDLFVSFSVFVNCLMILVSEVAFMYYLGINLNAVSLVNLVITIGISVEFCGHITYAYKKSTAGTPVEKATEALKKIGAKVLSGITLTKFFGLVILAFAKSQIFREFYFKMYLIMVISGALHGLIFLPALLCFTGELFGQY